MKRKIIFTILIIITILILTSCPSHYGVCPEGPVRYGREHINTLPVVLCTQNRLCGNRSAIDKSKEGEILTIGIPVIFFQKLDNDTVILGFEHNRFYAYQITTWDSAFPILFSPDNIYGEDVLRIALADDISTIEKNKISNILNSMQQQCCCIVITGKIRFYKSEEDTYFDSKHKILPELVISYAANIQNSGPYW